MEKYNDKDYLTKKTEESMTNKMMQRLSDGKDLRSNWKSQAKEQRGNQKQFIRQDQDDHVFTQGEDPMVALKKRSLYQQNLAFNNQTS